MLIRLIAQQMNIIDVLISNSPVEFLKKRATTCNQDIFVCLVRGSASYIQRATWIACGYSSANALEVTADIFRYYFGLSPREELVTGQADIPEGRGNVRAD